MIEGPKNNHFKHNTGTEKRHLPKGGIKFIEAEPTKAPGEKKPKWEPFGFVNDDGPMKGSQVFMAPLDDSSLPSSPKVPLFDAKIFTNTSGLMAPLGEAAAKTAGVLGSLSKSVLEYPSSTYESLLSGSVDLANFVEAVIKHNYPHGEWMLAQPIIPTVIFSGVKGHGVCGSVVPTHKIAPGVSGTEPVVRCALGMEHGGPHQGSVGEQWYAWTPNFKGIETVPKCSAVFGEEAPFPGADKHIPCGLDLGHAGFHRGPIYSAKAHQKYKTFGGNKPNKKIQFHTDDLSSGVASITSNKTNQSKGTVSMSAVEIFWDDPNQPWAEPVSLGYAKLTMKQEIVKQPVEWGDPKGVFTTTNAQAKTILVLGDSDSKLTHLLTYGNHVPGEGVTMPPEPPKEDKPKSVNLDWHTTEDEFKALSKPKKRDKIMKQASGLLDKADQLPLPVYLFVKRVVAYLG